MVRMSGGGGGTIDSVGRDDIFGERHIASGALSAPLRGPTAGRSRSRPPARSRRADVKGVPRPRRLLVDDLQLSVRRGSPRALPRRARAAAASRAGTPPRSARPFPAAAAAIRARGGGIIARASERDIVMLLPRIFELLVAQLTEPERNRPRVECGMIASSMKPFDAATNGLAKRASYSAVRAAIFSVDISGPSKVDMP